MHTATVGGHHEAVAVEMRYVLTPDSFSIARVALAGGLRGMVLPT